MTLPGWFFLDLVSVQEGQTIIRKGPYRFVCHPYYTGAILIMIGMGLDLRSWGACLCWCWLLLLCMVRIHVEDKALVERVWEEYRVYKRETKMLVPGVV